MSITKQSHQSVEVTAGIIRNGGKFLIARRSTHKQLAGFWEFPGGKIEEGETAEASLERELLEELGISVTVGDFFMETEHQYEDKTILLKAYFCNILSGEITLHDHDQIEWVETSEFKNYIFAPADRPFIKVLNGN